MKQGQLQDKDLFIKLRLHFFDLIDKPYSEKDQQLIIDKMKDYYQDNINKDFFWWYIEKNQEIAGMIAISVFNRMPSLTSPTGKELYIFNVYVEEAFRRQGLGKILLDQVKQFAKENNINRLFLTATDIGSKLYENYGFKYKNEEMEYFLIDTH